MSPILELDEVQTFIGQYHILGGVSFQVPAGAVTALLGRNGAGKTTTLKSILGLTPPRSGTIRFAGERLNGRRTYAIARRGIGYVPEYRAIFRDLTVREHLLLAERKRGDFRRRNEWIYTLFPDLQRLEHLKGAQLSGGQQQMLAIARALVPETQLLLIDEPSEGLAPVIIEQLMQAITSLQEHTTVLLVEQNFRMASSISSHATILDDGHTVHQGPMSTLRNDTHLIRTYLGAA